MSEIPQKSGHSIIVIDEQRSDLLNAMIAIADRSSHFQHFLVHYNHVESYEALCEDLSDKRHQFNWCKDPACQIKKEA